MGFSLLVGVSLVIQLLGGSLASRSSSASAYEQFRSMHRDGMQGDTVSYQERLKLFTARSNEVAAHNARGESWTMRVNHFADYTDKELQMTLGYKRVGGRWAEAAAGSSLLQSEFEEEDNKVDIASLAKTMDWRSKMNVSRHVHNQGSCGSCWAHAAVGALEAHNEILTGKGIMLSTQEIIDCTANPLKCGGSGGCHGATAEMAFEYATQFGIAQKGGETSKGFGKCQGADANGNAGFGSGGTPAVKVKSFVRLPENRATFLLKALATVGPVALSIAASDLHLYHSGVFSGCKPDTVVNHAVLGMGYGTDSKSGKKYWLIRNSWGDSWGEQGLFRSERHDKDDEYCGIDNKPEDGVYCAEHPKTVRVCGMCGITSDSTYPVLFSKTALRHQAPRLAVVSLSR